MQAAGYTLDVYCDRCGEKGEYVDNSTQCKWRCYSDARKNGWKLGRYGNTDLCPNCSGKKKLKESPTHDQS